MTLRIARESQAHACDFCGGRCSGVEPLCVECGSVSRQARLGHERQLWWLWLGLILALAAVSLLALLLAPHFEFKRGSSPNRRGEVQIDHERSRAPFLHADRQRRLESRGAIDV